MTKEEQRLFDACDSKMQKSNYIIVATPEERSIILMVLLDNHYVAGQDLAEKSIAMPGLIQSRYHDFYKKMYKKQKKKIFTSSRGRKIEKYVLCLDYADLKELAAGCARVNEYAAKHEKDVTQVACSVVMEKIRAAEVKRFGKTTDIDQVAYIGDPDEDFRHAILNLKIDEKSLGAYALQQR